MLTSGGNPRQVTQLFCAISSSVTWGKEYPLYKAVQRDGQ